MNTLTRRLFTAIVIETIGTLVAQELLVPAINKLAEKGKDVITNRTKSKIEEVIDENSRLLEEQLEANERLLDELYESLGVGRE